MWRLSQRELNCFVHFPEEQFITVSRGRRSPSRSRTRNALNLESSNNFSNQTGVRTFKRYFFFVFFSFHPEKKWIKNEWHRLNIAVQLAAVQSWCNTRRDRANRGQQAPVCPAGQSDHFIPRVRLWSGTKHKKSHFIIKHGKYSHFISYKLWFYFYFCALKKG